MKKTEHYRLVKMKVPTQHLPKERLSDGQFITSYKSTKTFPIGGYHSTLQSRFYTISRILLMGCRALSLQENSSKFMRTAII